jgi:hypothetical protein
MTRKIEDSEGYAKLKAAVAKDQLKSPGFHDYEAKLQWIVDRAKHYAEKTGLEASDILDAWESDRGFWYMNYYQECNQPLLHGDKIRVFETLDDMFDSIGDLGFRCPACNGISKSPYECDSGLEMSEGNICDWKVYGLFTDMGKGVYVFVKDKCMVFLGQVFQCRRAQR